MSTQHSTHKTLPMEHTYLRYECGDAFGITVAAASSKAPPSNQCLAFLGQSSQQSLVLLTTTGSTITGTSLKSGEPVVKIGHRDSGGALNSDEVVCLDVWRSEKNGGTSSSSSSSSSKVATGWVDGAVRIFDVNDNDDDGVVARSLLDDDRFQQQQQEPLLLNGHTAPVRTVVFDSHSRLASGGSDGTVVLWDIVSETGIFRLLGHRAGVTDISFVRFDKQQQQQDQQAFDGLISCSLDGMVKIWDLEGQCCTQTIARGEVYAGTCMSVRFDRWRLVTGGNDGQVRVWSVQPPARSGKVSVVIEDDQVSGAAAAEQPTSNQDDVCHFMGTLIPPPNVSVSHEKISCIHYHPNGRYVGILHANSKNVDVYAIRTAEESNKKRQRRLKRRQEKLKKKSNEEPKSSGKKRGILDDPESSVDEEGGRVEEQDVIDPELIKASDEFEYLATIRASHKVKGFAFTPSKERGELARVVCALSTNALETHSLARKQQGDRNGHVVVTEKLNTMDFFGHPTGIRSIALSSDDRLACTVSKNVTKIWNAASRTCIQSISPAEKKGSQYGLCTAFLPGNTHVAVGTREGHLLLIDVSAGDVVYVEEGAHQGAIWSLDIRRPSSESSSITVVTGSADKCVKFWSIESQDDDSDNDDEFQSAGNSQPMFVHTRTLEMTDDVIAVRYSKTSDPTKLMVFVSTLDSTIKVFFEDSLKMFLSLYGHKLPALAVDCSDDDVLLASSGADKTIKIWGLDFGDTHRTLHGHGDSITDLRFVKRTHNFFTASKDGSVRYWDADRFEQILLLNGHCAEVNCLAVSHTGAFVLSGGMDRQVRVWERTKDIVFLEEERERELEQIFDRVNNKDEGGTAHILNRKQGEDDDDEEAVRDDEPQSAAAVRRSVLSVSSGDRIMEALERADQELKDGIVFRRANGDEKKRAPNMMMLGLEPAAYILWVLRTIKSAEIEQSLIVLPLGHIERLIYYIIALLKAGRGVELCSRVAVFLVKTHQRQIVASSSMAPPLRELRRLIRMRLSETRDVAGFDLAALRLISKVANDRRESFFGGNQLQTKDIWAGLGLGRDVSAAAEDRSRKR